MALVLRGELADQPRPADLVVELDGAFVLPGLVDAHVHLVWSGGAGVIKTAATGGVGADGRRGPLDDVSKGV